MRRWLSPLLVLLLCLATPLQAQPVQTRRVLLVFGLNDFSQVGHFEPLSYAARDALRVFDTLTDPDIGGFNTALVFASLPELLELSREPALAPAVACILEPARCPPGLKVERHDPTTVDVKRALARLTSDKDPAPIRLKTGDSIVVYVATHGTVLGETAAFKRIHPGQVAFIAADSTVSGKDPLLLSNYLTEQMILDALEATRATHRLLIEATCHTDLGLRPRGATRSYGRENIRRTLLISDSSPGQSSLELEGLKATAFTDAFIEALRALQDYEHDPEELRIYDPDDNGAITVEEAYDWAAEITRQRTCLPADPNAAPRACQVPSIEDRSFFRREPFILAGNLNPPPTLTTLVAASLRIDPSQAAQGRSRGVLHLDGAPLTPQASAVHTPTRKEIAPGLHRLQHERGARLLLWVPSRERFGQSLLEDRLEEARTWGIGLGLRSGWGVAQTLALEAELRTTVLTTIRGATRLELGLQPGISLGSACLSRGNTTCPVNLDSASWQGYLEAAIQLRQQLPTRRPFAFSLGASLGPTWLHVYDPARFERGAMTKVAVVGGPTIGLEHLLPQRLTWRPEGGPVRSSPQARVQLRLSYLTLHGALTPEEFETGTASWHGLTQVQLSWLQQF